MSPKIEGRVGLVQEGEYRFAAKTERKIKATCHH